MPSEPFQLCWCMLQEDPKTSRLHFHFEQSQNRILIEKQLKTVLRGFGHCKVLRNCHCGGGNMKKQMKRADKSGAQIALILGEDEIANQQVTVKYLRGQNEQQRVSQEDVAPLLASLI